VSRQLNQEWHRLAADSGTGDRIASWPAVLARYEDATALLAAVGREGGLPMAVADQVLAELVRVGRHDVLAARIALQRVVPGLVRAALRRTAGRNERRQGVFDDLVANAWLVIRSYPIERRPVKIAVNVLRDAEYLTCVRPARLRSASERPAAIRAESRRLAPCGLDGRPADHADAAAELAEVLAFAVAAGVDRRDVAMLGSVVLGGWSTGEIAQRFAVTTRTVRNRRVRTTAAVSALMAATTAA
jgi:DNA-directed RNA polymerase specialized sigma24 family protein